MYKQYFKQAWNLMRQNRFYSAVYIVGTGLAISMVMVMAVVYHIRTANIPPEVHRDRMCYVSDVSFRMNDNNGSMNSYCGPRFVKEVIYELQTPEAVAVTTDLSSMRYVVGPVFLQVPGRDEARRVNLMGCNDQFWHVYHFRFLEGEAFSQGDFESALPRVVLAESVARRLFGGGNAAGQTVLVNEVKYTVSGVVADVSGIASDVYAEVWIPYTSISAIMKNMAIEREGSAGCLVANFLLRDADDIGALRAELTEQVKRYNTTMTEGQAKPGEPVSYAGRMVGGLLYMPAEQTYLILAIVLLLFLLVPALNLSGLNASHMQDRIAEVGVRKAFGASRRALSFQLFAENMLLMLPGGLAGLLFSYLLVFLFRDILLSSGLLVVQQGAASTIFLSPGMLLNMEVFFYTFLICLVLNLLSSAIPARRAVRMHITEALNG